jgi:hypothetical protein
MPLPGRLPARSRSPAAWRWALGVLALLSATAAWTVPISSDGLMTLRTSFSLLLTGSFRLPKPPPGAWIDPYMFRTLPGRAGLDFGYPPLGSLLRAVLLGLAGVLPPGLFRGRAADAALQLLPLVLTALAIVPLARLARFGGCSRRGSNALATALVVATFLGPLGRSDFQEPLVLFLAVWSLERVLVARRFADTRRSQALFVAGGLAALALLAKPTALVLAPALLFAAARPLRGPTRIRDFVVLAAGAVPGLAAFLGLNAIRFGSPLDFGYRFGHLPPGAERLPLAWTALRLTILPNRGVLWFAPLLLLAFLGPLKDRLKEPLRSDCGAAFIAAGGFFAANLWWWAWEGGFGWGPRLLAPAVALSIPFLAGHGRAWRRAVSALTLGGLALNLPAYLLDDARIYAVAGARPPGVPLGPVMPAHLVAGTPARVHPYQRLHYLPAEAPWLEGPKVLYALLAHGEGRDTGGSARDEKKDSLLFRLLLGRPALPAVSGVGRVLFDDAEMSTEVEPQRALRFARAAIDYGGQPVDTRAFVSMMLLRKGRAAEAADVCREALALDPSRVDVRSNLALAEKILGEQGVR